MISVKKTVLFSSFLLSSFISLAQTSYLPLRSEEYHVVDRLETIDGALSPDFVTAHKSLARKDVASFLKKQQQVGLHQANNFSGIDLYNIQRALSISGEWTETAEGDDGAINSRKPILKYFYQKQPDLIHVNEDDFFLVVNPVLYLQAMKENNVDGVKYINTRGAEVRGRIFNRVGFYTMVADNQEKGVSYVNEWQQRHAAFPGADYYSNTSSGGYDYLMARGYLDFNAFNDHLNVTFGYDKQFSGDGIRSLLIADNTAPSTFLRLRTRLWKLNFENLYLELIPDYQRGGNLELPKKYAAIHQVNINATPWLNIGIFESTMFGKADRFGVEYLVPVIGYNTVARSVGANQKTSLGFDFKAIALRHLQVYGQAFFDQVNLSELGKGWWGNQFGAQLGAKYFNAFTLSNLDLQGEVNIVRPFTYAANDKMADYTHYNQPLAHPYGAGFAEVIGVAKYQPLPRLFLTAKGIYAVRGTDSNGVNYGNNIFNLYESRGRENDYSLTAGQKLKGIYLNFNAAYELRPNIFIEAGATHLRRELENVALPSSTYFYGGVRVNISRREFDFY